MTTQNMSFQAPFVKKILDGVKILTTRVLTRHHAKLCVGNVMHVFTGLRTANSHKITDAIVMRRWIGYVEIGVHHPFNLPIDEFALLEGFDSIDECVDWFLGKHEKMICYRFKVVKPLEIMV